MPDDLHARFQPDYTPEQMESLGVYDALYRGQGPRLASLGAWKPEWISEHDPKGWAQWYKRYAAGRRIEGEDERQIKRWLSFKARHGGPFAKNPTPRRGWALRNWGVDPAKLVTNDLRNGAVDEMLDEYKRKAMQKHIAEQTSQLGKQSAVQSQDEIFDAVKKSLPSGARHASGSLADVAGLSDVDVSLPAGPNYADLIDKFPAGTQRDVQPDRAVYSVPGYDRPVNVYATADKARAERAVLHRKIQLELLKKYPQLAEQARELKQQGLKTEPAWAKALGLSGDPYEAMLNRKLVLQHAQQKQADLNPDVQLQEHQQRIADRITGGDNRLLVYHGLGSGKSLSALAAAEAAKKVYGDDYGIVVPAALKGNFEKEVNKFTTDSDPEIMSYTGLGMGKQFAKPPQTLIMDEAHRLRNPSGAAAQAASRQARSAHNLLLLTGSPITNSPTDLANLMSLLNNQKMSPEEFEKKFVGHKKVFPGIINWFRGVKPGDAPVVKNEKLLRSMLHGKVDYQPSKTPEGVNVDEKVVPVPLSPAQQKIQQAIRTKIPPGFLWKLDREFPLSRDELAKLNSFLTGLRQVSISTRPFRADKDPEKAFEQSAKLQQAFKDLQETLTSDERKKAIIYSNHIDAGLAPYAAALAKNNIPHAMFHGGISARERQKAVNEYNEGKLRALLIGPAGAEGLSTRGTSMIQLLDPHWHESRSQQAKGRGLRFDSHRDLPEELKNVAVRRYISSSEDPSWVGKLMGYQRERTGDEILEHLAQEKEMLNDKFREILKQEGAAKTAHHEFRANGTGAAQWFREKNALTMPQMSMPQMSWPESIKLPWTDAENEKTTKSRGKKQPPQKVKRRRTKPVISDNALAGAVGAGAAALPLISLHQDAYGTYPILRERVRGAPLYFADELAHSGQIRHGDAATYFGQPQGWFREYKPNLSKLTQGGEWTSGSGTFHGMLLRPHNGSVQLLEGGDSFPANDLVDAQGNIVSPFHEFMRTRNKEDAARGLWSSKDVDLYSQGENSPRFNPKLQDLQHNTSPSFFNRYFGAFTKAVDKKQEGEAKNMSTPQRFGYYLKHLTRQGKLLDEYKRRNLHLTDNMDTWDDLANRTSYPMLITRTPQIERLLDSKNQEVADQTRANIDKAFVDYKYRPYNLGGAMSAGARRVLFPKITPTEQATALNPASMPSLPPPKCTQDYCVQPLARVYEHHGVPMGAAANVVLPADIAANAGSIPVGMVVPHPHRQVNDKPWTMNALNRYGLKPTAESLAAFQADPNARLRVDMANPENAEGLKKYREDYRNTILYDWMPRSRNRRIATGLLAAAALGAAGYGGTKLVQSMIKARQKRLAQEAAKEEAKKKRTATRRAKAAASMLEVSTPAAAQYFATKTQKPA